MMFGFVSIQDHERMHAACAIALGIRVDRIEIDRWPLDGVVGHHGRTWLNHDDLARLDDFTRRKTIATIAMLPEVAIWQDPWGDSDRAVVDEECWPTYSIELWRWWIDSAARRVYTSEAFNVAYAEASERIEQQLAEC
jgi:hypothetical protein